MSFPSMRLLTADMIEMPFIGLYASTATATLSGRCVPNSPLNIESQISDHVEVGCIDESISDSESEYENQEDDLTLAFLKKFLLSR